METIKQVMNIVASVPEQGALPSFEKVYEVFITEGFLRFFDGFFLKAKAFFQRCTRFCGCELPLGPDLWD